MANGTPNPARSQALRAQCSEVLHKADIHDAVGAVEMLTADVILALPGISEKRALGAADAIAGDVRSIIRERFAARKGGH